MLNKELKYYERKIKNAAMLMIWIGWVAAIINIPLILEMDIFNNYIVAESELFSKLFAISILFQLVLFTIYLICTKLKIVNFHNAALTLIFLIEISTLFYFKIDFNIDISGFVFQEYQFLITLETLKIITLMSYAVSDLIENFIYQENKTFYLSQIKINGELND